MVVAEAALRFRGAAEFDDLLVLDFSVTRLGKTSLTTELEIIREGKTIVEASMRHAFFARDTRRKQPIPATVRHRLEAHLTDAADK
jgi:acyl-CoA thioesterase FadM